MQSQSGRSIRRAVPRALVLIALLAPVAAPVAAAENLAPRGRRLTFAQRVEAQRAVERVYHDGRIGSTRPFDQAVPPALLERKVRTSLAQSAALEMWGEPITAAALRRELERIAADTRSPERLEAIERALDEDPFLIQETFVRAELADRLVRAHLEGTGERGAPLDWETWVRDAQKDAGGPVRAALDGIEPPRGVDVAEPLAKLPQAGTGGHGAGIGLESTGPGATAPGDPICGFQDLWDGGDTDAPPAGRSEQTAVWTGSEMIVWGGSGGGGLYFNTGGRYDPVTDSWHATSVTGAPPPRSGHAAVWTGSEMIVWGGSAPGTSFVTGGRYDPVANTWTATSTMGAPSARTDFLTSWTGSEMIVWGGYAGGGGVLNTGARYNPSTDSWIATSIVGAPILGLRPVAVWSGSEMIVWGGLGSTAGAVYDPAADSWRPTSMLNAPGQREQAAAVWTGTEMVVWGGSNGGFAPGGGRYNPATDIWRPTGTSGAPLNRAQPEMVWTGSWVILWGGLDFSNNVSPHLPVNTGALYDPVGDTWTATSLTGAPSPRYGHTAVWSGDRMIVWGGNGNNNGGRYDPAANTWLPTSTSTTAPSPRQGHTAVWTGSEMIIWGGGLDGNPSYNDGARYDPLLDAWIPTPLTGAPTPRHDHTAVWTGSEMIVWGGQTSTNAPLATGARYDPVANTWTATATTGAPAARALHTAIWDGAEMIVWGGSLGGSQVTNTGGRYDPAADAWTPTPLAGAPPARAVHTVVWTGSSMIVWGGGDGTTNTNTGGRFDPLSNIWSPTSLTGAPFARSGHTAVWTGQTMIVWGGGTQSGGIYDPLLDSWTPTPTVGAPFARSQHSAVWTGSEMIVWGGWSYSSFYIYSTNTGGRFNPATGTWTDTAMVNAVAARDAHTVVWTGHAMIVRGGEQWAGDLLYMAPDDRVAWYGSTAALPPDADGDGVSVCEDCDDANAGVHAAPGEVSGLSVGASGDANLAWNALAGGGMRYDVLRTSNPADYVNGAVCMASDASDPAAEDDEVPPPGGFFYYLVRAENACPAALGMGPLGFRSNGQPIQGRSCP